MMCLVKAGSARTLYLDEGLWLRIQRLAKTSYETLRKKDLRGMSPENCKSKLDHGPKLFSGLKLTVFLFIPISLHPLMYSRSIPIA